MTFIQNYRDLRDIHIGFRKAERDIARIENHIIEHNFIHDADTNDDWDCHDFNRRFFGTLGLDVEHDTAEAVGYNRGRQKHQKRMIKDAMRSDEDNHGDGELTLIPIEMDGDESQDELMARVHQAIREHDIFLEQVSETDPQNPDQKESK